jgi:hypothetical protein
LPFGRELPDPAFRGMQPQLQGLEGQPALDRDDDLAVEHELAGSERRDRSHDIREIAAEGLARFRAQFDVFAVPESEAAEAVPFGFIPPMFAFR